MKDLDDNDVLDADGNIKVKQRFFEYVPKFKVKRFLSPQNNLAFFYNVAVGSLFSLFLVY